MYNLPYFKEDDVSIIKEFILQYPFAFLTGSDEKSRPVATQIPVFLEEENEKLFISGHMMRNTDHHKAFMQNNEALVVFTGPHCYVSATWYSDPHQASTWNYMSVHARGKINFPGDEALVEVLRKTTLHFEKMNGQSTTIFDNLPDEYRKKLMPAIVAFRIELTSLENVFKLSQNRDKDSYINIIEKLSQGDQNERDIANEMKQRLDSLFPPGENDRAQNPEP